MQFHNHSSVWLYFILTIIAVHIFLYLVPYLTVWPITMVYILFPLN